MPHICGSQFQLAGTGHELPPDPKFQPAPASIRVASDARPSPARPGSGKFGQMRDRRSRDAVIYLGWAPRPARDAAAEQRGDPSASPGHDTEVQFVMKITLSLK